MLARPTRSRPTLRWTLSLALVTLGVGFARPALVAAQATKPVAPPTAKQKTDKTEKAKREAAPQPEATVDLNTATAEELATLPGVGEATARKIIDGRPYQAVGDLAKAGVPARTIDGIKGLAVVRPVPPAVDLNTDPVARVETLPGIGPALAKEIVANRPFADYADLERVKGLGAAKIDSLRGRVKFGKAPAETAKAEAKKEAAKKEEAKAEAKQEAAKKEEAKAETAKAEAKKADAKAEAKKEVAKSKAASTPKEAGRPGQKINLNTASLEALDSLPGIGQYYSQAIVDNRPYSKIEDIMKIKGIKEVEFNKIKDMISVDK